MEVRTPAVSGTFYPGDEKELKNLIHEAFCMSWVLVKCLLQILMEFFWSRQQERQSLNFFQMVTELNWNQTLKKNSLLILVCLLH